MSRERKSIVAPLLLAFLFGGPGGVTFMFALRESRSWNHDWLLISVPLLVLALLSLTVVLFRLFRMPGGALGLLLLAGGLGWAGLTFKQLIATEEQRWADLQELKAALPKLLNACHSPSPVSGTTPYSKDRKGAHAVVLFEIGADSPNSSSYSSSSDVKEAYWHEGNIEHARRLADVELVGCIERKYRTVDRCSYGGGNVLEMIQTSIEVTFKDPSSGIVVAQRTFEGGPPGPCPDTAAFARTVALSSQSGSFATQADLVKAFEPILNVK